MGFYLPLVVYFFIFLFFSRHEFDSEQIPDLTKDLYLQDIHCVGSLCKLYFRELPNPLLTYQLYEKFSVSTVGASPQCQSCNHNPSNDKYPSNEGGVYRSPCVKNSVRLKSAGSLLQPLMRYSFGILRRKSGVDCNTIETVTHNRRALSPSSG